MSAASVQLNTLVGHREVTPPPGTTFRSDEDREIYRAAQEFEGMFVKRMLAEMEKVNKLLGGADEVPGTASASSYQDMVTDHMTNAITSGGGLGLAAVLWGQMRPAEAGASA